MASSAKRKGKIVPSRYKQAADKISSSNSSKSKSSLKSSIERSGEFERENCSEATCSKIDTTFAKNEVTSTPFIKGQLFPSLDASAVTAVKSNFNLPQIKVSKDFSTSQLKGVRKKNKSNTTARKCEHDSTTEKYIEAELDIMYAEYLQSKYLEQQARKSLKLRNETALAKIHKLLKAIEKYMVQEGGLRLSLNLSLFAVKIFEHVEKQKQILKPLLDIIPTLETKYKTLAEAVENSKHKLPVTDVSMPESIDEVEILLQKIKEFLSEFLVHMPDSTRINISADEAEESASVASLIAEGIKRACDLEKEFEILLLTEASLSLGCEELQLL